MPQRPMTSRERLWAVLSRQEPDRVPIWLLYPGAGGGSYADVEHAPSYARVLPVVRAQTDTFDRRDIAHPPFYTAAARVETQTTRTPDLTIHRHRLATPYGDLTAERRHDGRSEPGAMVRFYCTDVADLDKVLAIPYEPPEPDVTAYRQAAQALGEAGLMTVPLEMPVSAAYDLVHPETFALWTLTEREALIRFTRVIFEREYAWLEKALQAGAGPAFFALGSEFVAPPLCAPRTFQDLVVQFDAPLYELIHRYGGKVLVHHHGRIAGLLEQLADMGADGIQPIEEPPIGDCPLAEAKRRIGDRVCLVGSVQYDDFERLTPDEMEALVRRQLRDAASGGGMVLASTAGPYAAAISPRFQENTLRLIAAAHHWGAYPLPTDL